MTVRDAFISIALSIVVDDAGLLCGYTIVRDDEYYCIKDDLVIPNGARVFIPAAGVGD